MIPIIVIDVGGYRGGGQNVNVKIKNYVFQYL
jgi:hypothetical protein